MTAYSYNLPVNHLVFGAAAALHFDCPEDEQSVEMIQKIRTEGLEKALEVYTGLTPNHPLFDRIIDVYHALGTSK